MKVSAAMTGYNHGNTIRKEHAMVDQEQQKPVVIQQGGNGVGLVLAALIMGGAIVYAANIWSNTQQQKLRAPAEAIQKGVETVREAIKPDS